MYSNYKAQEQDAILINECITNNTSHSLLWVEIGLIVRLAVTNHSEDMMNLGMVRGMC